MAIRGSLREASLPDVLQLLAMGQKTGCLSVTERSNFASVFFERGRISYAMLVNRADRLGDRLVQSGRLSREELDSAIAEQERDPNLRLGHILVNRGAISTDELESYVRVQIEEAVYSLFSWSQGSFYFEADQRPEDGTVLVSLNPENLLLEGARRVDEWSLIEQKIPSLELIFRLDAGKTVAEDVDLTSEQQTVLPLLDGERTVREVVDSSALVEFDACKAIYGLLQAGIAHPVGRRRSSGETGRAAASAADQHRNLAMAFYRTGMWDEAAREFQQVDELEPADPAAPFFLALVSLRRNDDRAAIRSFQQMVKRGGSRAPAFAGIALALERAGRLSDALTALDEAIRHLPERQVLRLSRAILLLKSGDAPGARLAFREYRAAAGDRTRPPPAFYVFAVLAEAASGHSESAVRLGEEGIGVYPSCAPLLLHVGAVWERQGEEEVAETMYARAADEDPKLAQAHKALGDIRFRRGAYEQAAEDYRRAIGIAPSLGDDVFFKLGTIHYQRMEREEAVQLWSRALELNPANEAARTNLELVQKVPG